MPSQAIYRRRAAAGLCPQCGRPNDRQPRVQCTACYQRQAPRHHAAYRSHREARWEAPGANLVACCNSWHEIPRIPYRLVCCGRFLALYEPREEDTHASA
jgi:hypothetical protein